MSHVADYIHAFWKTYPEKAYQLSKAKGWHDGPLRDSDTLECLFHSEWSEAFEEYRRDGINSLNLPIAHYSEQSKPEGFWVEVADFLIRLADIAGKHHYRVFPCDDWDGEKLTRTPPQRIVSRGHYFSEKLRRIDEFDDQRLSASWPGRYLQQAIEYCHSTAYAYDIDLVAVIKEKHAYNETRPYRHGGKHA